MRTLRPISFFFERSCDGKTRSLDVHPGNHRRYRMGAWREDCRQGMALRLWFRRVWRAMRNRPEGCDECGGELPVASLKSGRLQFCSVKCAANFPGPERETPTVKEG